MAGKTKKGDIVKVSYTGRFEGDLIETTDADVAKKEGAFNPKMPYSSVVVVVGEGHILPGLDNAMIEMESGDKKSFKLTPKDAFGERSFKMIKLVPSREFKKQKVNPFPGMVLEVEGRPAKIQSVSGGRVRVDFNHPLAGKEVEYELKLESVAGKEDEKVSFLIERAFKNDDIKATISGAGEKKKITISVPKEIAENQLYQVLTTIFKSEAEKFLGIKEVDFVVTGEEKPKATKETATKVKAPATTKKEDKE